MEKHIEELAESFVNGNITHVVSSIGKLSSGKAALVSVGVYRMLSEVYLMPHVARTFNVALERIATD